MGRETQAVHRRATPGGTRGGSRVKLRADVMVESAARIDKYRRPSHVIGRKDRTTADGIAKSPSAKNGLRERL